MLQHGLPNAVGSLRASCRRLLLMSCAEAAAAAAAPRSDATVARSSKGQFFSRRHSI